MKPGGPIPSACCRADVLAAADWHTVAAGWLCCCWLASLLWRNARAHLMLTSAHATSSLPGAAGDVHSTQRRLPCRGNRGRLGMHRPRRRVLARPGQRSRPRPRRQCWRLCLCALAWRRGNNHAATLKSLSTQQRSTRGAAACRVCMHLRSPLQLLPAGSLWSLL